MAKRGRPKVKSTAILVRMLAADLAWIDGWRAAQPDKPNRPEAIRRLVRLARRRRGKVVQISSRVRLPRLRTV